MYSKIDMNNKEEAVQELKKIKNILSKYKKAEVQINSILLNILQLNAQLNTFEIDIFMEYIKLPLTENKYIYNLSDESKKKIDDYLNILGNSNDEIFFHLIRLFMKRKKLQKNI